MEEDLHNAELFMDEQNKRKIYLKPGSVQTFGRSDTNSYQVDLETRIDSPIGRIKPGRSVSRNHATLKFEYDGVYLWDNHSSCGTYIKKPTKNGYSEQEIVTGKTKVNRGDIIILGFYYQIKYLTKKEREELESEEISQRKRDTWKGPVALQ